MISLTTYEEARDAFRQRDLRQALYDEGDALMHGVIVNLHGEEHLARRRLENRLFRRDVFAWYERRRIPEIIDTVLAAARAASPDGMVDLLPVARRTMMTLALDVAGVDRPDDDAEALDVLYELMDRLARASTVAHATGDKQAIVSAGDEALAEFESRFFAPSLTRRRTLVEAVDRGTLAADQLPRDVLTTLLVNQDRLDLPYATVLREVAYFPWVGSHSTSNQFVHAMHHLFEWIDVHPADRNRLTHDAVLRQRFVHESLRLHPASPVAARRALEDVRLRSGRLLPAGSLVAIDMVAANRDRDVFGDDADEFNPFRRLPDGVAPWGLSFGHGLHACLGQELAGGLEPAGDDVAALEQHLLGSITVMAGTMLSAGAHPDPALPARRDTTTSRQVWATYPVRFGTR